MILYLYFNKYLLMKRKGYIYEKVFMRFNVAVHAAFNGRCIRSSLYARHI